MAQNKNQEYIASKSEEKRKKVVRGIFQNIAMVSPLKSGLPIGVSPAVPAAEKALIDARLSEVED